MSWKTLEAFNPEHIAKAKEQFHMAAQSVAAVGRHFLEESTEDENAVLFWDPELSAMVGKWVPVGNDIDVRSGLSLSKATIFIQKSIGEIVETEIDKKTFPQLMTWIEGQLGGLELPMEKFSANLPYEIPNYPMPKRVQFNLPEKGVINVLSAFYENCFTVLQQMKKEFENPSAITIWPHHFDEAISIVLKDSGSPDTSTYLGLGMSPGDEHYSQPYFYVNSWPYVEEQELTTLSNGEWHIQDWVGAILPGKDLSEKDNQEKVLLEFYKNASGQLKKLLLQ